jgi:hypothetical protein
MRLRFGKMALPKMRKAQHAMGGGCFECPRCAFRFAQECRRNFLAQGVLAAHGASGPLTVVSLKRVEMADSMGEGPTLGVIAPSGRLKLQTNYGQALILGKGYTAPETLAAFARARELLAAESDSKRPD